MNKIQRLSTLAAAALFALLPGAALADPLAGEVLKFQQLPMDNTPIEGAIFDGHDEWSTAWGDHTTGLYGTNQAVHYDQFMADDFADNYNTPVVHVRWWGSYQNNQTLGHVQKFLVSFESDVANVGPFSYPGTPLLSQVVLPGALSSGSGTYTETLISPAPVPGESLYMYNAELKIPFQQVADTVYWLKIVALVDPNLDGPIEWGWHSRDWTVQDTLASPNVSPGEYVPGTTPGGTQVWHFQDDSISGLISGIDVNAPGIAFTQHLVTFQPENYVDNVDGPTGIAAFSKDLAFELYTIPEPSTYALGALGLAALVMVGRRKGNRSDDASPGGVGPSHRSRWRSLVAIGRSRAASVALAIALCLCGAQLAQAQISYSIDWQSPQASGGGVPEGAILVPVGAGLFPPPATAIPPGAGGLGMIANISGTAPELDALSYGTEPMLTPNGQVSWELSVDEFAVGIAGNAFPSVFTEGSTGAQEASADIYASATPAGPLFGGFGSNTGLYDGNGGLTPFASQGLNLREPNPPTLNTVPDINDNLDAWESGTTPGYPVYFSMDSHWADPLETTNTGTALGNGFSGADVVVTTAPGGPPVLYAAAAVLGLDKGAIPMPDDLDALVLAENGTSGYQPTTGPYSWLGVGGTDMLLYSVRRGSGVIGTLDAIFGMPIEEGDILIPVLTIGGYTPGIFMNAERLGLATVRSGTALTIPGLGSFGDDLDALDVQQVPEPSTFLLGSLGLATLALVRRRTLRTAAPKS